MVLKNMGKSLGRIFEHFQVGTPGTVLGEFMLEIQKEFLKRFRDKYLEKIRENWKENLENSGCSVCGNFWKNSGLISGKKYVKTRLVATWRHSYRNNLWKNVCGNSWKHYWRNPWNIYKNKPGEKFRKKFLEKYPKRVLESIVDCRVYSRKLFLKKTTDEFLEEFW